MTMIGLSRAVVRPIEAGSYVRCAHCDEPVRFTARDRGKKQIIANVYEDGVWQRVDHFHYHCYADAGHPHGPPT